MNNSLPLYDVQELSLEDLLHLVFQHDQPAVSDVAVPDTLNFDDLAQLFQFIYECAELDSGPLREQYPDQVTAVECQDLLNKLQLNELASLLEKSGLRT